MDDFGQTNDSRTAEGGGQNNGRDGWRRKFPLGRRFAMRVGILRLRSSFAVREAATPLRMTGVTSDTSRSVAFAAGALPVDQLADSRTGAGYRLLVGFDFRARGFFADGANAESDFLLFGTHLDDLELVLDSGLKMKRLTVAVQCFRLVAQALHA